MDANGKRIFSTKNPGFLEQTRKDGNPTSKPQFMASILAISVFIFYRSEKNLNNSSAWELITLWPA